MYKRPHLDQFLKLVNNLGEVYIFTASQKAYADPIIDMIDPNHIISKRFYREHCKKNAKGELIKDMSVITKDLKRLVIVDDA